MTIDDYDVRDVYAYDDAYGGGTDHKKAAEFDTWLNAVKADAWDEGFDAGEQDVMQHEQHDWANACIVNPYRNGGNNV